MIETSNVTSKKHGISIQWDSNHLLKSWFTLARAKRANIITLKKNPEKLLDGFKRIPISNLTIFSDFY